MSVQAVAGLLAFVAEPNRPATASLQAERVLEAGVRLDEIGAGVPGPIPDDAGRPVRGVRFGELAARLIPASVTLDGPAASMRPRAGHPSGLPTAGIIPQHQVGVAAGGQGDGVDLPALQAGAVPVAVPERGVRP